MPQRPRHGYAAGLPRGLLAGNLTDDPEVRYTEAGIARAMFRMAVSGRREHEPSFFTVFVRHEA